jgi:heterotetrameric sarcosine oxidase gamma subunit
VGDLRVERIERMGKVLVQQLGGRVPPGESAFARWLFAGAGIRVLERGPMERLVVSETLSPAELIGALSHSIADLPLVLTDVSHAFELLRARGMGAPQALAADVGVSLSDRDFPVGTCARTSFAQASVTIHRLDVDVWDIYIERPLAGAAHDWLMRNVAS